MASRVINKGIEQVAIDLLKHHPRNANHGDVEAIKKSLAVNGWYGSVVVNTATKHILAGNHRVMAAKALGWETVPVQWVDVTPEEELRILVVDNRTTRIGQDDTTKITDILAELANTPIGLDGTGYGAADLDALIDELAGTADPAELLTDPDEVPEEVETRCQPGDLWILGRHRLLCGDSTKADDVARLMDGVVSDLLLTDPPYGMRLNTDYSKMPRGIKTYDAVIGDDADFDFEPILTLWQCEKMAVWGGGWFYETLPKGGSWLIWDKQPHHTVAGPQNHFEECWIFPHKKRIIIRHLWTGFTAKEKGEDRVHPTQKAVTVINELANFMGDWNICSDPFLGSGTTLIVAEQLGRKCYGMEISPKYCDVVIQRWENATGQKAVLSEG